MFDKVQNVLPLIKSVIVKCFRRLFSTAYVAALV